MLQVLEKLDTQDLALAQQSLAILSVKQKPANWQCCVVWLADLPNNAVLPLMSYPDFDMTAALLRCSDRFTFFHLGCVRFLTTSTSRRCLSTS